MPSDQGRPDDQRAQGADAADGGLDRTRGRQRDIEDDPAVAGSSTRAAAEPAATDSEGGARRGAFVRVLQVTLALLAVALFLGVVWYAYTWGSRTAGSGGGGQLPVVRAQDGPEKVRPDDPGGMEVPHQDKLVMNREADEGEVERLLPPPETPQPPEPAQDSADTGGPAAPDESASSAGPDGGSGDGAAGQGGTQPDPPDDQVADLPETAPPDGGADSGESAGAATEDGADDPDTSDIPPVPGVRPDRAAATGSADSGAGAASGAADAGAGADAPAQGGYAVQLAAFRDKSAARAAWARYQRQHPDLLGGRQLLLQRTEVDGQGSFWRVRTGPFAEKAQADALCRQLKAAGRDCLSVGR